MRANGWRIDVGIIALKNSKASRSMRRGCGAGHSTEAHGSGWLDTKQIAATANDRDDGSAMPTYIMLSKLTPEGTQTIKTNPQRIREVNREIEQLGATVKAQWAVLGRFDFVNVVEAPDIATVAKVSVALGARGSTKIETLPALDVEEFLRTLE